MYGRCSFSLACLSARIDYCIDIRMPVPVSTSSRLVRVVSGIAVELGKN